MRASIPATSPRLSASMIARTRSTSDGMGAVSRRYLGAVTPRRRVLAFGSAAASAGAGSICAAAVGGRTGDAVGIALITLGLGAVVLLLFYEVGLSEER